MIEIKFIVIGFLLLFIVSMLYARNVINNINKKLHKKQREIVNLKSKIYRQELEIKRLKNENLWNGVKFKDGWRKHLSATNQKMQ